MTSSSPPAPVQEGDILDGKYQVERVLGLGGMGIVVAARHLQLEQQVAIKFVLPEAVGNAEAMERFAREARAAVKLRSEHVARVLDVGRMANGAPYMVMEYLEGQDLGQMVASQGALAYVDSVDFVLQACEAVAEAHANGIIHRDLKPANLFVTHAVDGKPLVKVLDFGISKQTSLTSSQNELSLTRTTSVVGSPNYMSPEQLRSSKLVDTRTDIWALGVILYEVLTARVPFEAETVTQLTAMVLQDTPRPVYEVREEIPVGLGRVVARCLEKDPGMRYPSVAELARELEPFGSKRGVALRIAQVTGPRPRVPESSPSGRAAVTGGTSVAWGETQLAEPPKRRALIAVAAGLAVIALVGVGTAIGLRAGRTSAGSTPAVEVTPTVRQIDIAAPPPSAPPAIAPVVAAIAPAPTASVATPTLPLPLAVPTSQGAAKPAPARSHPAAPAKPPKHGGDELPSERN